MGVLLNQMARARDRAKLSRRDEDAEAMAVFDWQPPVLFTPYGRTSRIGVFICALFAKSRRQLRVQKGASLNRVEVDISRG
jgi:hypothetical protein